MNDNDTPGDIIHTVPIDDLRPHLDSWDCPCRPRREEIGASVHYIHNSWDGREILENAVDYLDTSYN